MDTLCSQATTGHRIWTALTALDTGGLKWNNGRNNLRENQFILEMYWDSPLLAPSLTSELDHTYRLTAQSFLSGLGTLQFLRTANRAPRTTMPAICLVPGVKSKFVGCENSGLGPPLPNSVCDLHSFDRMNVMAFLTPFELLPDLVLRGQDECQLTVAPRDGRCMLFIISDKFFYNANTRKYQVFWFSQHLIH